MADFLIHELAWYPWLAWLLVILAGAGLGYAAVWAYKVQVTAFAWLGYRRLVWKSKAAVRRHLLDGGCPACVGPDVPENVKAADLAARDRSLSVECPRCGAGPFQRCRREPDGAGTNITHHARVLEWCETSDDDPPEYQHPDGPDGGYDWEGPGDDWSPGLAWGPGLASPMAGLAEVLSRAHKMGLLDDDQLPDGPPAEASEAPEQRCTNRDCDLFGFLHRPPCRLSPTMPAACYPAMGLRDGPAMPPQPWSGLAASLEVLARGDDSPVLTGRVAAELGHDTTEAAVDSMFTRAQAREVQAMITDGVITPE